MAMEREQTEKLFKQQIARLQQELKSVSRAQAAQNMRNYTSSRAEQQNNSSSFKNYKTQKNDLINFHTQNQSGESLGRMNGTGTVSVSSAKAGDRRDGKYMGARSGSTEDNYNIGHNSVQKHSNKASTVQNTMSQSQGNTGSAYLQK